MAQPKLNQRIAEESQLLAEERWIKEALTKIKNQRNCLQIERLHLESMKGQLKLDADKFQNKSSAPEKPLSDEILGRRMRDSIEFEVPIIDEGCNEELNLDVNNHGFGNLMEGNNFNIEEEEDEDMGDEDLLIDMNMFMNGNRPRGRNM
ncbi:uncharacterized protein LOC115444344 [Manduca sexta]|uniref:Uncharacterized protein n=1 Tax=Manduca sexta TaxID=7130 RepID=A0A921Z5F6_MANSE|nr:uncharacterized protein LOC115444344 [Manduca sexta]KAG6451350.1 hypothetical protein O3G_MSEX007073 [Manduca sexta]